MGAGGEEDDSPVERARYEGMYKDGMRTGFGKMTFPGGDVYEGEWLENKVSNCVKRNCDTGHSSICLR